MRPDEASPTATAAAAAAAAELSPSPAADDALLRRDATGDARFPARLGNLLEDRSEILVISRSPCSIEDSGGWKLSMWTYAGWSAAAISGDGRLTSTIFLVVVVSARGQLKDSTCSSSHKSVLVMLQFTTEEA
mmetsp:Transcript_84064/g.175834  ORF Transcript_84064/g.175834 Transcript_84064/m.175834 type:complete len:133 (+) Transcript_84064:371-769(+)